MSAANEYQGEVKLTAICGNISAGKSTVLKYLSEQLSDQLNFMVVMEPTGEWEKIVDHDGKGILQAYYDNPSDVAATFQMAALGSRFKILRDSKKLALERSKEIGKKVTLIIERTILDDFHVFAKMLHHEGKINTLELNTYKYWYDIFLEDFNLDKSVYIYTPPEVCYSRVNVRCRPGEEKISMEYLEHCDAAHNNFHEEILLDYNCMKVYGHIDKDTKEYDDMLKAIVRHFE